MAVWSEQHLQNQLTNPNAEMSFRNEYANLLSVSQRESKSTVNSEQPGQLNTWNKLLNQ